MRDNNFINFNICGENTPYGLRLYISIIILSILMYLLKYRIIDVISNLMLFEIGFCVCRWQMEKIKAIKRW